MTEHDTQDRPTPGSAPPTLDGGLSEMTVDDLTASVALALNPDAVLLGCFGEPAELRRAGNVALNEILRRLADAEQRADAVERELVELRDELDELNEGLDAAAGFNAAEFDALNAEEG